MCACVHTGVRVHARMLVVGVRVWCECALMRACACVCARMYLCACVRERVFVCVRAFENVCVRTWGRTRAWVPLLCTLGRVCMRMCVCLYASLQRFLEMMFRLSSIGTSWNIDR